MALAPDDRAIRAAIVCTQGIARGTLPARKSNKAPTPMPRVHPVAARCFWMNSSCLGLPIATSRTSAFELANAVDELRNLAVDRNGHGGNRRLMLRAHRGKPLRRALGDAGLRAQQEDPVAMPRRPQVVWDEIRAIEIFGKRRPVKQAARDVDADAVIEDE